MHDFGITIKVDNIKEYEAQLPLILRLLVSTRSPSYAQALLTWMSQLSYLRQLNHPAYRLLSLHPTLLNEEVGEISLSQLARHQSSVHQRASLQRTSANFAMLSLTGKISDIFREEAGFDRTPSGYIEVDPDGAEVKAATNFFTTVIRKLSTGQFQHYTGKPDSWSNTVKAHKAA